MAAEQSEAQKRQHLAKPEILAPAGDVDCFLAALAAGADAIYLGLKNFSARMEAENFGLGSLCRLTELAHGHSCRVYVAMNSILKPGELSQAYRLVRRLATQVAVDGLIVQDPGMLDIARQAGFEGSLALSTLANVCNAEELLQAAALGVQRVILPRELDIEEMRVMGENRPAGLELECFVHGALCYCVSGRCYWSSYMGGRSGLRGRCTQPCRRVYERRTGPAGRQTARTAGKGRGKRFFACQDLELASVVRALLTVPGLASWKIEGRKKGPHYVFHTVTAYRMLRDGCDDPQIRSAALSILELALGRPGVRARFLPQNSRQPMAPDGQTSSGRLAGVIRNTEDGKTVVKPHFQLLPQDYLRIGVEDERWHATMPVTRITPKGGSLVLRMPRHRTPPNGTPVYLIDRREPELKNLLRDWHAKLDKIPETHIEDVTGTLHLPRCAAPRRRPDMLVRMTPAQGKTRTGRNTASALWLSSRSAEISQTLVPRTVFWLYPAIWPEDAPLTQKLINRLWRSGARHFVLNSPWQRAFFPRQLPPDADLVAGPFCNLANPLAFELVARSGFSAAFASPEPGSEDLLRLPGQSPLPLGLVIEGNWPVGLSRFGLLGLNAGESFASQRGEIFWSRNHGGTWWIYPAWKLDLSSRRQELLDAGYSFFATLEDSMPQTAKCPERPGLFNWDGSLL